MGRARPAGPLAFVHGGGAHAHWWTHAAATFAAEYRVLAIDLSGHGDSSHRAAPGDGDAYGLEQWTDEVVAVAGAGGITARRLVVGHSMGWVVTIATAARHGEHISGAIICDSPVTEPDPEIGSRPQAGLRPTPHLRLGAGRAAGEFCTVPAQEHYLDYVIDHVGRRSLKPADGGWQWKFDRMIEQFSGACGASPGPTCPACGAGWPCCVRSAASSPPTSAGSCTRPWAGATPVIEVPLAGHHPMLDEPLLLLTAIRTLLATGPLGAGPGPILPAVAGAAMIQGRR